VGSESSLQVGNGEISEGCSSHYRLGGELHALRIMKEKEMGIVLREVFDMDVKL